MSTPTVEQELQRIWGRFEKQARKHFITGDSSLLLGDTYIFQTAGYLVAGNGDNCFNSKYTSANSGNFTLEDTAKIESLLEEKYPNTCKCGEDCYKDQSRCPSCQLDDLEDAS